ncbi:hypothetical protein BsWGS_09514 [Bradybaena similaris]
MAEKGGILALAQKQLSRTKTKVLQNLGKAEKTTDEPFNDIVLRIEKQQEVAHHLQKELKAYANCLREMSVANKNLTTAIAETYEAEWTKDDTVRSQLQTYDLLWNDCLQTLQDSVVVPLNNYLNSFPALKVKIAKRGRKMVDYDNSRHNLEVLQAAKKKDEAKIQKALEEVKEVKKIYEELNNELHTELPDFNNSRVTFYAGLLSSLFSAEHVFHSEVSKLDGSLNEICQELGRDFAQFVYQPKRPLRKSAANSGENGIVNDTTVTTTSVTDSSETQDTKEEDSETKQSTETTEDVTSGGDTSTDVTGHEISSVAEEPTDDEKATEDATDWGAPSHEPVISPPPNTMHKVMATHNYTGEDLDELNFVAGEVIYVIPFDSPEEQDEGWQMGIKASDGIQGVFPENFTQRL